MTRTPTRTREAAPPIGAPAGVARPRRGGLSVSEAAERLEALREKIRGVEEGSGEAGAPDVSGGPVGRLEEWASEAFGGEQPPAGVLWSRVLAAGADAPGSPGSPGGSAGRRLIVWVGAWCWLNPRSVDATPERWLWLRTSRQVDRVWAVELCCRNPAVSAVVADGRGLGLAATRRLQLAARAGGVRVLLARTPDELRAPSAAPVRGLVDSRDTGGNGPAHPPGSPGSPGTAATPPLPHARGDAGASPPRWNARLLRRKGLRPTDDPPPGEDAWVVEKRHARVVQRPPGGLADRPAPAKTPRRLAV